MKPILFILVGIVAYSVYAEEAYQDSTLSGVVYIGNRIVGSYTIAFVPISSQDDRVFAAFESSLNTAYERYNRENKIYDDLMKLRESEKQVVRQNRTLSSKDIQQQHAEIDARYGRRLEQHKERMIRFHESFKSEFNKIVRYINSKKVNIEIEHDPIFVDVGKTGRIEVTLKTPHRYVLVVLKPLRRSGELNYVFQYRDVGANESQVNIRKIGYVFPHFK